MYRTKGDTSHRQNNWRGGRIYFLPFTLPSQSTLPNHAVTLDSVVCHANQGWNWEQCCVCKMSTNLSSDSIQHPITDSLWSWWTTFLHSGFHCRQKPWPPWPWVSRRLQTACGAYPWQLSGCTMAKHCFWSFVGQFYHLWLKESFYCRNYSAHLHLNIFLSKACKHKFTADLQRGWYA